MSDTFPVEYENWITVTSGIKCVWIYARRRIKDKEEEKKGGRSEGKKKGGKGGGKKREEGVGKKIFEKGRERGKGALGRKMGRKQKTGDLNTVNKEYVMREIIR